MPARSDELDAEERPVTNDKLQQHRVSWAAAAHHVTSGGQSGLSAGEPVGGVLAVVRGSWFMVLFGRGCGCCLL